MQRLREQQVTNFLRWNVALHVVVEAKVDHVENSIASHSGRQALVETSQTEAIVANYFASLRNSRRLL